MDLASQSMPSIFMFGHFFAVFDGFSMAMFMFGHVFCLYFWWVLRLLFFCQGLGMISFFF